MTKERAIELLKNALDYVCEIVGEDRESYRVLKRSVGLTDDEIDELGFDFSDVRYEELDDEYI